MALENLPYILKGGKETIDNAECGPAGRIPAGLVAVALIIGATAPQHYPNRAFDSACAYSWTNARADTIILRLYSIDFVVCNFFFGIIFQREEIEDDGHTMPLKPVFQTNLR